MSSGFSMLSESHFYCAFYALASVEWAIFLALLAIGLNCPITHRYGGEGSALTFLTICFHNPEAINVESVVLNLMYPSVKVVNISHTLLNWLLTDATLPFPLRHRAYYGSEYGEPDYSVRSHMPFPPSPVRSL